VAGSGDRDISADPSEPAGEDNPAVPAPVKAEADAPAAPTAISITLDTTGTIVSADERCAPMLVGLDLGQRRPWAPACCAPTVIAAMEARQAVIDGRVLVEAAPHVSGVWRFDAAPRFDPAGHFTGYDGLLRRAPATTAVPARNEGDDAARERLSSLLTRLRAATDTIEDRADAVQQQRFGPASQRDRALAARIAAEAAEMFMALDEVGRPVEPGKDETSATDISCDLAAAVRQAVRRLPERLSAAVADGVDSADEPAFAALSDNRLRGILDRLLPALANQSAPGERLALTVSAEPPSVVLAARLPRRLAWRDGPALLAAASARNGHVAADRQDATRLEVQDGGIRLAVAAAHLHAAGGTMHVGGDRLVVRLPQAAPVAPAAATAD
jgi:two-component system, OmpR family, sensor kinase